ncbi:MAG: YicC family protein [Acidobacteria bacterium]|nr:YicC family protein [Acidobacteriota bacterium]
MPRSMTGFARVQTETPEFSLTLRVKSVNHRFLDLQMRLPAELDGYETAARQAIKRRIVRGSLQVSASLETRGAAAIRIKDQLVESYLAAYRELAARHGVSAEPDLNAVFRLPGIVTFGEPDADRNAGLEKVLLEALDRALDELDRAREGEAAGIVEEMARRSQAIETSLEHIEQLRSGLSQLLAERLTQKLSELLKGASVDPQRILQEAALLADRSDISEEVQRLRAHNEQLRALLASSGELGKKLDFLLQEMNREANTIVSKTSGIGESGLAITDLGLSLKAEIEKIREQGMNLE